MNLKIYAKTIDETAKEQINTLMEQEVFRDCKVRIMPDVHAGAGCVIGFTADLGNKVIPNIVGVDIGCGMLTVELGNIDLDLHKLDEVIKKYVPSGFNVHENKEGVSDFDFEQLRCYKNLKGLSHLKSSMGTLGGGNHFIEIDVDDEGNKYLVIHTGSRNLGKQVADYYQELANQILNYNIEEYKEKRNKLIAEYKEQGKHQEIASALEVFNKESSISKNIVPKELSYLEGNHRDDYLHDMRICQRFAIENRKQIASEILSKMEFGYAWDNVTKFETIHNYIDLETNIVRKGAISAKKDEILLIPINMRDGCIVGKGKGNDDWNQSAPHGAGRLMGRMEAKRQLNMQDFTESMKGIFTTTAVEDTIDEAPMAYKPIEDILDSIGDTVEVLRIIKPIYNYKATGD